MKYTSKLINVHKPMLKWLLNKTFGSISPQYSVLLLNLLYKMIRKRIFLSYDKKSKLFAIHDKEKIHFFGDLIRGIGLYSNGLIDRAQSLFNSYLLSNISFNKNSIVIDCGANYADLWLSLRERINKHCYITFEPGFVEFQAIKKNAPDGKHSNIGLSNKEGKSKFYVNQKDGDSSLIEPSSFTKIVEVKTTTLNKYFNEHKIKKIKLLKLEAEGFEPEILQGANRVLKKIEYVAVDGSHERGKKNEETFSNVCNILFSSNFKIVSINFYRQRALFVQKQNKK